MGGHLVHLRQEGESDAERKTPSWFRQQQETNQMALLSCEQARVQQWKRRLNLEKAVLRGVLSGEVGRPLHVALWNGAGGEGQAAGGQRRPLNASHQRTFAQALSEKCFAGWAAEGMLPGGSASGGQQLCLREPHALTAVIC